MIVAKDGLYSLIINATTIPKSSTFRIASYSDYKGNLDSLSCLFTKAYSCTATVDLSAELSTILSNMKSNTRNEIRRAEKEGIQVEQTDDLEEFVNYYNIFAREKGLPLIKISNLAKYGEHLIITRAYHNGNTLSMHASIIDIEDKSAALLFSCSTRLCDDIDRKMIGWSNRFLHYKDYELFKQMGLTRYEWSGVCVDPANQEQYNIGLFKLSLGGDVRERVTVNSPLFTLLARLKAIIYSKR